MLDILSIFPKQIHYPNNLADGLKSGVIYHGVSKNFMTGISSFTNPFYGVILERHSKPIENSRQKYLMTIDKPLIPVSKLDDFILLSESQKSYWVFCSNPEEPTGSLGNIPKSTMTIKEFSTSIQKNIQKINNCNRVGSLTGEHLIVPAKNKTFIFHQ